jgi:DNA-directed RNA polymerase specialized sigma24 family protein
MAVDDSIRVWLERLQAGDEESARELWERYFPRLIQLARARLRVLPRKAAADEEDVALSAFDSFCRRVRQGGFPDLRDRDGLWRVLMTVTARKAARLVRDQGRLKRGGGLVAGESALDAGGLNQVPGPAPSLALEAELSEQFVHLLDSLRDEDLKRIALWKLDGHTNAEIAGKLNCAPATVERRLALIRKTWERDEAVGP